MLKKNTHVRTDKCERGEKRRMGYARPVLIVVGIIVLLMGILGLVPGLDLGTEPEWHAAFKIIIGLVAIVVGAMEKKET